jgi:hypothetical protein
MKTTFNNNNNKVSYLASKKEPVRKLATKLQHVVKEDSEEHIPSRWNNANANEVRELTDYCRSHGIILDGVRVKRKYRGSLYQVINYIIKCGCEDLKKDLENKQQQSTYYAFSKNGEYRADKIDRLMRMKTLFKVWDTETSSSNYPVFHLMTIKNVIKDVCKKSKISDERTMYKKDESYLHIIINLSKEVRTSMFDITGFMQHEFTG